MNYFIKLYTEHRSLALITWGYLIISVLALLLAGIFALMNQDLGRSILFVPLLSFLACICNLVIWALIKLGIDTLTAKDFAKNDTQKNNSQKQTTPTTPEKPTTRPRRKTTN